MKQVANGSFNAMPRLILGIVTLVALLSSVILPSAHGVHATRATATTGQEGQEVVVTKYPWNWPRQGAPAVTFVGGLPASSKGRLFSDYLQLFTPKWGQDWGEDQKRKYLIDVKFIAQQLVWWQDNLCQPGRRSDVYEFSTIRYYHASAAGAQRFFADIGRTASYVRSTKSPNRQISLAQETVSWRCDSSRVELDVKTARMILHRHNVSTTLYLASPKLSSDELEKVLMKFADEYEKWLDGFAVPLSANTEFEVPPELAFYNNANNAAGQTSATTTAVANLEKSILGSWRAESGGSGLFVSEPLVETNLSFSEGQKFEYSFSREIRPQGAAYHCRVYRMSNGNYRVSDGKVILYPELIDVTVFQYGMADPDTCRIVTRGTRTGRIDASEPITLAVSLATSSTSGEAVTTLSVCNERVYGTFQTPDLFEGCVTELVKRER